MMEGMIGKTQLAHSHGAYKGRATNSSYGHGLFPPFFLIGTNPPEIQGVERRMVAYLSSTSHPLVLTKGTNGFINDSSS